MIQRGKILNSSEVIRSLIDFEQLGAQALDTVTDLVSVWQALTTARGSPLSAYDSVYLDRARDQPLALATLDKSLRSAATKADVELVS